MKVKILFLTCLVVLASVPAFAQTRTVTNADLEKFRQKRVQAEQDYRENYEKMGFPSPEELERQLETARIEREALSARLAEERLRREELETERLAAANQQGGYFTQDALPAYDLGGYYGFPNFTYHGGRMWRGRNDYRYPSSLGNIGNGRPTIDYGYGPRAPVRSRARFLRR